MQEMRQLAWVIHSSGYPTLLKYCPKCGRENHYHNSEKFRVNANKKNLDIWLIYSCKDCADTYNLTIFERIKPHNLSPEHLEGFMTNHPALVWQYAYDAALHKRAHLKLDYSQLTLRIEGALPEPGQTYHVSIEAVQPLDLRLDWLLSQKLDLSRSQIKQLADSGRIALTEGTAKALEKQKLNHKLSLRIQL